MSLSEPNKRVLTVRETVLFAMLGALMFVSKIILEVFPNIHLLGMFTMVYTIAFRKKALIPIYVYVLINGIWSGFATWWIPYLYVWTVLWAVTMLLPQNLSRRKASIIYPLVCSAHGFLFGTLYAPAQALLFGLDFKGMLTWIALGFYWDIVQGIGNFVTGFLVLPLSRTIKRL